MRMYYRLIEIYRDFLKLMRKIEDLVDGNIDLNEFLEWYNSYMDVIRDHLIMYWVECRRIEEVGEDG